MQQQHQEKSLCDCELLTTGTAGTTPHSYLPEVNPLENSFMIPMNNAGK